MEKSSLQPLARVRAEWAIPQQLEALADALTGAGPALAFGESSFNEVPQGCALVLPTSGSSGAPKSVALTSGAVIASAKASHSFLHAEPELTTRRLVCSSTATWRWTEFEPRTDDVFGS